MTITSNLDLASLPKAELHVHIEGTLEPELMFGLAERNHLPLSYRDVDELRARYKFTSLQDFLDLYYENMAVLRTEADFYDLTRTYLARAKAEGVRHAEIFFDPQAHIARGIPVEAAFRGVGHALETSERDFGVSNGLIVNFLRDRPPEEAMDVLRQMLRLEVPILGVGLDSAEAGYPPSLFSSVFALAHACGLHCVAHAGEEGPPSYVWEALDVLHVARIDHGVRSMEDGALVERLATEAVPLTVCPLSNIKLGVFPTLAHHPIVKMLSCGLQVTVNSDDPAYFGGYISENYRQLVDTFGLKRATLAQLARNSIAAAFVDPRRRSLLTDEVDGWELVGDGPSS
ncbi:MAG TPA: adenosine deaminase [Acidimicrobiales bacterium]|nr:adenosine deaminase [Acidimicrobiales bacterium]